ncbi:MAG: hypothetical protein JNJ73_19825 [Hyphomonadaceae bacterium]|nr:hypothetical protein [Hyphomonadaceae bacterium]
MIHIVTAENRHLFRHALMEMHQQRKTVFVDELKWRLNVESGIEIDSYDSPSAVYLIEAEAPRAPVRASVRLLPTDRPHLMADVFPHLCSGAPPAGAHVWEATRFCPSPDLPKGDVRRGMLSRMIAAVMETALLFGIERVTYVASASLAAVARDAGWITEALGAVHGSGRDALVAMVAEIDAAGLRRVRERNGIGAPVTRFTPGDVARAA